MSAVDTQKPEEADTVSRGGGTGHARALGRPFRRHVVRNSLLRRVSATVAACAPLLLAEPSRPKCSQEVPVAADPKAAPPPPQSPGFFTCCFGLVGSVAGDVAGEAARDAMADAGAAGEPHC